MKRGKQYRAVKEKQPQEQLSLVDGIKAVKKLSYSKFTGAIDLHLAINLPKDVDAKSLKGSITLPHSVGQSNLTIAVFTGEENKAAAIKAGAKFADLEELIKNVKAGKVEFDVAIATPDVMPKIAMLGKQLGPRGLMPNPKTGTVTPEFAAAVKEYKNGKMNFKSDDSGVMHFKVGTTEMDEAQVKENVLACVDASAALVKMSLAQAVKGAHLAPSMGPSVKVNINEK
jgi:large subunit ribosomal protein L1